MKATVNRKQLIAALQAAKLVVPTKFTLPVLGNVMLRAHDGQLTISATNLDQFIVRTIDGSKVGSKEAGAITLPLKALSAMVSSMKSAEVTIEAEKDKAKIVDWESGLAFPLAGLPAEEFPPEPGVGQCVVSSMSSAEMLRILNKVSFAASNDPCRLSLCGTYLKLAGQDAEWVATNGRHMACAKTKLKESIKPDRGWIIPVEATKMLIALLKDALLESSLSHVPPAPACTTEYLTVAIYHKDATTWFTTKLVDGQYPNYRVVIPSEFKFAVDVGLDWLVSTLDMAMKIIKDDKETHAKLAIDANGMTITIRYNTDDAAEIGKNAVEINRLDGPDSVCLPFSICFNAKFMLDAARRMSGRQGMVKFLLIDGEEPVPITIVDDEHFYILMPVRRA